MKSSKESELPYRQRQERRRKSFYDHRRRRNTANVVHTYSDVSNSTEAITGVEAIEEETGEEVSVIIMKTKSTMQKCMPVILVT